MANLGVVIGWGMHRLKTAVGGEEAAEPEGSNDGRDVWMQTQTPTQTRPQARARVYALAWRRAHQVAKASGMGSDVA